MGVAISRYSDIASNELVARFCGPEPVCPNDPFWNQMLSFNIVPPATAEQQLTFDAHTEALLARLLAHNARSGNLGALVSVTVTRAAHLLAAPPTDNVILAWHTFNALFVVRAVCKYLVEVVDEHTLCTHLDGEPQTEGGAGGAGGGGGGGGGAAPRDSRVEMLIDTLISLLIDVPVTDKTYWVHVECLSTLLVLLSVHMFAPTHGHAHRPHVSLVYRTLFGTRYTLHAPLLVRTLLAHATALAPAPPDLFGTGLGARGGSLLIDIASGLWSMLSLSGGGGADAADGGREAALDGLRAAAEAEAGGGGAVAERLRARHPAAGGACLLLLALTHHCMERNLYRQALLGCQDANTTTTSETASTPAPPADGRAEGEGAPPALRHDMAALHAVLCATVEVEHFTLLLYVLLHSCAAYRRHVLGDPHVDTLLVPVLKVIYSAPESSSHHVYMALIVLLILTEDDALNRRLHTIMLKPPGWYRERALGGVSAGGLAVLVVLRALHRNLAQAQGRDRYLHTNCLAAIGNMSSEFRALHPYVCQRLLSLLEVLSKRRARLCADIEGDVEGGESSPSAPTPTPTPAASATPPAATRGPFARENTEEIMEHICVLDEVTRMLLEIVNSALTHQLQHNLDLVYALLHRRQLFAHHQHHPVTQNIDMVIGFFSSRLQRVYEGAGGDGGGEGEAVGAGAGGGAQLGPGDVMQVLRKGAAHWSADRLKKFPELKFRYVEEERPEEFFTPYVWALCAAAGVQHWASERLPLLAL